ncbi:MAG: hypothetical protein IKQ99_01515 [Alphaproteobacteria bacterium]|nr:hypothetical protein [Alphaproteobacteria bacterium]
MGIIARLKQKKRIIAALALGCAFFSGAGYLASKEYSEKSKGNVTQTDKNINQKIDCFTEYVNTIQNGGDKEEAYRKFVIDMTKQNAQEMEKMQKQLEKMQRDQKAMDGFLALSLFAGAFFLLKGNSNFNSIFGSLIPSKDAPQKRKVITYLVPVMTEIKLNAQQEIVFEDRRKRQFYRPIGLAPFCRRFDDAILS